MGLLKRVKSISKNHLLILLLLCFSGNPLFVAYGNYRLGYIVCLCYLVFVCLKRKQSKLIESTLLYLSYFALISVLHIVGYGNELSPILFFITCSLIGCLAIGSVGREFEKCYVDVMYWLALISLVLFAFFSTTGIVYGIRLTSTDGVSLVFYTHLLGYGEIYARNSGMFWEPGAYQGYLNIALFLLLRSEYNVDDRRKRLLVLSLALFSTQSTTGYLVFGTLVIYYVIRNKKMAMPNKLLLLLLTAVVFSIVYTGLDFLQNKIQHETSTSELENSRLLDYLYYEEIIRRNVFWGTGLIDIWTGNGFIAFFIAWGVVGVFYYFIAVYSNLRRYWNVKDALFFVIIIVLCLQGEGFLSYPLFLGLPFLALQGKQRVVKS